MKGERNNTRKNVTKTKEGDPIQLDHPLWF